MQKFIILILAVFICCHCSHAVYAQEFWSIYDEEEAKKKAAEEAARQQKEAEAKAAAAREAEEAAKAKKEADRAEAAKEAAAIFEESQKAAEEKRGLARQKAEEEAAAAAAQKTLTENTENSGTAEDVSSWFGVENVNTEGSENPFTFGTTENSDGENPAETASETENTESSEKEYDPLFDTGMFIAPVLGLSGLSDPFTVSIRAGCEFTDTKLISPFFFGGGLMLEIGFPKEDFPYSYKAGGSAINPPELFACTLYAPAGIIYGPFENKHIQLEMAMRLGLKLLGLVSLESSAASDCHCAFYTAMTIGADFYNAHVNLDVSYDSAGGFSPGFTVSYRFKIRTKRRAA